MLPKRGVDQINSIIFICKLGSVIGGLPRISCTVYSKFPTFKSSLLTTLTTPILILTFNYFKIISSYNFQISSFFKVFRFPLQNLKMVTDRITKPLYLIQSISTYIIGLYMPCKGTCSSRVVLFGWFLIYFSTQRRLQDNLLNIGWTTSRSEPSVQIEIISFEMVSFKKKYIINGKRDRNQNFWSWDMSKFDIKTKL